MDKILFYAYRNKKNRFFIPSKLNHFGPIICEYVMINSGCNTLLIPLKENELDILVENYPKNAYRWVVSESHGVSSLNSLSLSIMESHGITPPGGIKIRLAEDVYNWVKSLDKLRFHLCSDDAVKLLKIAAYVGLERESIGILENYIIDKNVGQRRKHVLFGQTFLRDVCSIQAGEIIVIIDSLFSLKDPKLLDKIADLASRKSDIVDKSLGTEFNDLVDEDHDGDDESFYSNSDDEYYDE